MKKVILNTVTLDSLTSNDIIIVIINDGGIFRVIETTNGFICISNSTFMDNGWGVYHRECSTIKELINSFENVKEVLVFEDVSELKEWMRNCDSWSADFVGAKTGRVHYRDLVKGDKVRRVDESAWNGGEFKFDGEDFIIIKDPSSTSRVGDLVSKNLWEDDNWEYA